MIRILGVFREVSNSPNREHDDTLILKAVGEELAKLGAHMYFAEPESVAGIDPEEWDAVIPMCENPPVIKKISAWKDRTLVLNPMEGVLNCYRVNMTPRLAATPGLHPRTELLKISEMMANPPAFMSEGGAWIKRGDVHNMTDHDVVFVKKWPDAKQVRDDFKSRGITHVAVQEHVPGDIIKFYGVGPGKWFAWFYHRPQEVGEYAFDQKLLASRAAEAAAALKLEIYGGDAIVTPEGRIYIIDINSWPSFARVREDVKTHIAKHVYDRARNFKRGAKAAKTRRAK
jgi:hypothetical protein